MRREAQDTRERRNPRFEVRGSKFRKPRTSDLEPSLVVRESRATSYASRVATFHGCARSPVVRRSQILEADRFHSGRLWVARSPRPPARLQTTPPTRSPLPTHQKYPFGHEEVRVPRRVLVSKLCDLAQWSPCRLLLSAQHPSLWSAYHWAWSDRPGPRSGV